MPETREKHLRRCKDRALEYLRPGKFFSIDDAIASMASDLGKHDETRRDHQMTIGLMLQLRAAGKLETAEEMRKFIEEFN